MPDKIVDITWTAAGALEAAAARWAILTDDRADRGLWWKILHPRKRCTTRARKTILRKTTGLRALARPILIDLHKDIAEAFGVPPIKAGRLDNYANMKNRT